jgi:hypothetical protein
MKPASRGETTAAVLKRLPEITQWRAEGIAQREIARRLGIPDSSLRHTPRQNFLSAGEELTRP